MQFLSSILFLLTVLCYSNFYSLKFKIDLHKTFLLSVIVIIFLGLIYLKFLYGLTESNEYFFYSILFIGFAKFFYIKKNFNRTTKLVNLEFILIYLFFFLLSQDNYFLDQDEFTYWGKKIKNLHSNGSIDLFKHHGYSLDIFRYLFIFFKYNEGLLIFSNNVIIICGLFYLFYNPERSIIEKIILFLIFTLLINNLSFGYNSIYSDPILAILFASALKFVFKIIHAPILLNKIYLIVFCCIFLFVFFNLNRASSIYIFFMVLMPLYFISKKNFFFKNENIFFLNLFLVIIISEYWFNYIENKILTGNYLLSDIITNFLPTEFLLNLKKALDLLQSPIYFSNFGVSINTIADYLFSIDKVLVEHSIPLFFYIIFLFILILISSFDNKIKINAVIYCMSIIFTYSFILIVLKYNIEKLSILALPRYIGILILALILFIISIPNKNENFFYKKYYLITLIIPLLLVSPKKTFGFFVPDSIYYSNKINLEFKKNRNKISLLKDQAKIYDNYILIHSKNKSDITNPNYAGYHTFYHDILFYEIYPNEYLITELNEFKNKELKFDKKNTLIILYDLNENDKILFKEFNNIFEFNSN